MSVSTAAVANLSTIYSSVPPSERPTAAARAGYRSVESWWPFESPLPSDQELTAFVDAIETAGVELVALNFSLGDPAAGERGILSYPERAAEFREHVEVIRELAVRLGVRLFCAPYGDRRPGLTDAEQQATAVANLVHAHRRLSPLGGVPMLEPLSGVPTYPLRSAADAVAVIDQVDAVTGSRGAVGLLADLYHLTVNGADIDADIDAYADRIVHVQLADHPGRHEPGTGRIDFDRHLTRLRAQGFRGRVALEYFPSSP
ncbi:hydroxypyruvate isomerase family protein [Pseudonocardia spinosispora]|uniref:hydroxypyruvate isomerase family protein n=1 Tax=Pseudonocardia spinosispora TaxID=103441 RepID=UPI0003FEFF28|nr:TIM barrel protein [Pseudonocardia spinosispora]